MSRTLWRAAVLGTVLIAATAGCAEERDPINRVQANALAKSFFVGDNLLDPGDDPEFFTQATLIDAPYGVSQSWLYPSTWSQTPTRIKFQITEDLLLGRMTYEHIDNADNLATGPTTTDGQIVVAYKILSHFDIRRGYNPSTGEELNVIEENTTDRPWYEREYFRVDWSENLQDDVYDFDTLSIQGVYGGVSYTSLAYYVNDPSDPDAPYFDTERHYFDVTNKAYATPELIDLSSLGWGIDEFPACWLPDEFSGGTWPVAACNPTEITIRQAFLRLYESDYEPQHMDGWKFQGYGAFVKERMGYTRNYGMTDDRWYRFVSRYNIWERYHYYDDPAAMAGAVECYTPETTPYGADPLRDDDKNGTDDECEEVTVKTGVAGSQCDQFLQKCTLPYRLRTATPLPWYYSNGSNPEYYDATEEATHNWDVAFRKAIMVGRYAECRATQSRGVSCEQINTECACLEDTTQCEGLGNGGCVGLVDLNGNGEATENEAARACEFKMLGDCAVDNPVFFGQQDDNLEALQLAKEVDDCRHGLSYPEYGALNSEGREAACVALADSEAAERAIDGNGEIKRPFDPGVVALAKMPEMIVLCHSPVEQDDPPICAPAHERLPAGYTAEMCDEAEETRDPAVLPVCRAARFARRGDLRYHLMNVFEEPHSPSSWGIYTDAEDPLTGEKYSAAVNVWSHINDLWGQMVVDRLRFARGELDVDDVTEADYVYNYSKALEAARKGGVAGYLDRNEVRKRIASMGDITVEQLDGMSANPPAAVDQLAKDLRAEANAIQFAVDAPSMMSPVYEQRRRKAQGTEVEASLMNTYIQKLGGVEGFPIEGAIMDYASPLRGLHPGLERKLRQLKAQSVANQGGCILTENDMPTPMALADFGNILEQKFADMCVAREDLDTVCDNRDEFNDFAQRQACGAMMAACAVSPAEPGCTCEDTDQDGAISEAEMDTCCAAGIDPWYTSLCTNRDKPDPNNCLKYNTFSPDDGEAAQNVRAERMRKYISRSAHKAVIVHEMGHSIGQRHNFVSSSDALVYRPQYWQLRTKNGTVTRRCGCSDGIAPSRRECEAYEADGENCIGPRYYDPVTENEAQNLIWGWQQSSVMDYAGEQFQDMLGLAVWDYACASIYYGDAVAVFDDPSYRIGKPRAPGMLYKMDNFGGILGFDPQYGGDSMHYSEMQNTYELIYDCQPVRPETYRPASWNEAERGAWHPVADGLIVAVDGVYSKCRQQKVDYVPYDSLHIATGRELDKVPWYRAGPSVDDLERIRVPYGFATDRWADLGNASVYRHDNGADVYEIFNWLATQQEINHIFDSYRRGRATFSVRYAANRNLSRYNEKIRDGAKGLGLIANIYRLFGDESGLIFDRGYWAYINANFVTDNAVASFLVFDHFVKTMARPEAGPHYKDNFIIDVDGDPNTHIRIMRSDEDTYKATTNVLAMLPNGATGAWGPNIASGGKLIENRLCEACGEFDADFTMNAGSYYDKVNAPYLMTESVDNFISDSRFDFVDGRYRAISIADLYPDGYRRWLGNMLTLDEDLKGPRLASNADGDPLVDENKYPEWPLGWPSYIGESPTICWPAEGTNVCGTLGFDSGNFDPRIPDHSVAVDSQVDWETQKFLINWTMLYLPENEKQNWINQLRVYELGLDADPKFANRIEFHDPYGRVFVAKSYGRETVFGREVEKGVAARVLEYANLLLEQAYVVDCTVTPENDPDGDGTANWCVPVIGPNGTPLVRYQEGMIFLDETGNAQAWVPGCGYNPTTTLLEEDDCPCSANRSCVALEKYITVPAYIRQTMAAYGIIDPEQRGIFDY